MTPITVATRNDRIHRTLDHLRQRSTDLVDDLAAFGPAQYTDPAIARRERDLVFGRVPPIVAHASELPEPGDFITRQMPRNRVIVARQQDGSVKSFVNVCRHRWSYNTDGSLRTITRDSTFGEPASWKLMQDAFADNYHIQYAHPNTAAADR